MITTGIPITYPIAFPTGQEPGSYNVLFDNKSTSNVSHTITVEESPFVVEAFGLTANESVEVWCVGGPGPGTWFMPLYVNGNKVVLTNTDNKLSLDVSGRYQFRLNGQLGSVYVVGHDANVASSLVGLGKYVV
jgi:hypothetical protein